MKFLKRIAILAAVVISTYFVYVKSGEMAAIIGVAIFATFISFGKEDDIESIRSALRVHAKRLFPEYGDD